MAESITHINYVKTIHEYVLKNFAECINNYNVLVDLPDSCSKPNKMQEGYVPDLYFENEKILIIGEAKTTKDFEREHTYNQLDSYMMKCHKFKEKAYLIICVPWEHYITAINYCNSKIRKNDLNLNVIVMNDIGDSVINEKDY
jgi:calcineurin-like phosphoesterase family protein